MNRLLGIHMQDMLLRMDDKRTHQHGATHSSASAYATGGSLDSRGLPFSSVLSAAKAY